MARWHASRLAAAALLGAVVVAGHAPTTGTIVIAQAQEPSAKVRADRLNELFRILKSTKIEDHADIMVLEIWALWGQSGRPEIDVMLNEAVDHMRSGHSERALAVLDEVVKAAPEFAEGWNKRATVLYILDEHDRSLADIDRVLALEPRHFGAIAGQGMIAIAKGQWKAALDAYKRALTVNPYLKERHELIPALEEKAKGDPI